MFDRVILHIGRHKCGTSSLQYFLSQHRAELSANSILYPKFGTGGRIAHHDLAMFLNPSKNSEPPDIPAFVRELAQEANGIHDTIILSSEAFQNIQDLTYVKEFCHRLCNHQTEIVCYFRELVDYAISSYRQFVHAQTSFLPFWRYAVRFQKISGFLTAWKYVGALHLRWYEREQLKNSNIIDDFLDLARVPVHKTEIIERNPSIGGDLFFCKLVANKFAIKFLDYNRLSALAGQYARWRQPFYLKDSDAVDFRRNSEYNSVLSELLGYPNIKSWSAYEDPPSNKEMSLLLEQLDDLYGFHFPEVVIKYLTGKEKLEWRGL